MGLIDFILNLAGLLLWLSWRALPLDALAGATPRTLAGTVRRAGPSGFRRWHLLAGLLGLLLLRALFYWQIGPAVDWTPKLDLGVVALAFRGDRFAPTLLFSIFSFARTALVFYFWVLTLAAMHGPSAAPGSVHKLILLQLGRLGRWPRLAQFVLPLLVVTALWMAVQPLLALAGIVDWAQSAAHLAEQGLLVALGLYLTLKILLPAILLAHLVATYVYLGGSPVWDFVSATAQKILAPFRRLPLRFSRIDFAPLVAMVVILLLLQALPNFILFALSQRDLALWPR